MHCKENRPLVFVRALAEQCVEMLISAYCKLLMFPRVTSAFGSAFLGCSRVLWLAWLEKAFKSSLAPLCEVPLSLLKGIVRVAQVLTCVAEEVALTIPCHWQIASVAMFHLLLFGKGVAVLRCS